MTSMSDTLSIMMMELELNPEKYPYDDNTKILCIFRYNMAIMAKVMAETTDSFTKPERLNIYEITKTLVESIEWVDNNIQLPGKTETK